MAVVKDDVSAAAGNLLRSSYWVWSFYIFSPDIFEPNGTKAFLLVTAENAFNILKEVWYNKNLSMKFL